ncbi:TPA: hypothetical protein UL242_002518 [Clostridioides difficile]|uniref:hypothetical protein n=1 Tax=Clostridioides difficile TaxID=1496 RepID=UPI000BB1C18C|nr:hypothetical protein [Clostridioides difficile]EGT3642176.1 hypothetical protein [Clostridioides difficile]MBH7168544.1 hypothetical protein [Clostridioides difficile]MBH7847499.1 hypothetical protein [Clostridioides difficile]MBY1346133.1 hypothetical protein [Clostridioides difficile]MBY1660898.1 hypothetical protein [Clostridioides difficile]
MNFNKDNLEKKFLRHQIIRIDGSNVFFEVLSNAFPIGKVQINFRKYDKNANKGEKFTQQVDIFINIENALVLCQDILSGKIEKLAVLSEKEAKQKDSKYPQPIWKNLGGTSVKKLKEQNKERKDGYALSRMLKLSPGKIGFLFTAEEGKGEETDTGLITPRYNQNPDSRILVPLNSEQLKTLALMIKIHIESYLTIKYNPYFSNSYWENKQ